MPPKTSNPNASYGFEKTGGDSNTDFSGNGEQEVPKLEKAAVGSLVTIELLDSGKISQFLITQNERNAEELPPDVQARLPEGANVAHNRAPLAIAALGKTAGDEILELVVTKRRPFKILEVKAL